MFLLAVAAGITLSFTGIGVAHATPRTTSSPCLGDSRGYEDNGGTPTTRVIQDNGHDTAITTEFSGTCIWYHGCYNWSPPGGGSASICHLQFYPNGNCITWDSSNNLYMSETCATYEAKQQLFWQFSNGVGSNYLDVNAGSSEHLNTYRYLTAIFLGSGSQVNDEAAGAGGRQIWFIF